MYLSHLVERLGKYLTATFLPGIKGLATKYVKRKGGKGGEDQLLEVLVQLLKEVPLYRNLVLPDDEGTTVLDQHVRDATARIPELDSLIQQTLQYRSMLISSDQGNAVSIDLSVPSTRDFIYRVLMDLADELSDSPLDAWLHARPSEIKVVAQQAVRGTVDSYLPYIRRQIAAAGGGADGPDPAGDAIAGDADGGSEDGEEKEGGGDAQQMTIKVSKGALRKANPEIGESDDEGKGGKGEGRDEFEDDDDDEF